MLNKTSVILVSIVCLITLTSCSYLNKKFGLADDNILEETGEAVLEAKTGISADFTPDSPEKK